MISIMDRNEKPVLTQPLNVAVFYKEEGYIVARGFESTYEAYEYLKKSYGYSGYLGGGLTFEQMGGLDQIADITNPEWGE